MHILLGIPLTHASRSFEVVSLDSIQIARDGQEVVKKWLTVYSQRSDELEQMNLDTFVRLYNSNGNRRRSKEPIIRYIPFLKPTLQEGGFVSEKWAEIELMKYIPWRVKEDLLQGATSYSEAYELSDLPLPSIPEVFENNDNTNSNSNSNSNNLNQPDLSDDDEEFENETIWDDHEDYWMEAARQGNLNRSNEPDIDIDTDIQVDVDYWRSSSQGYDIVAGQNFISDLQKLPPPVIQRNNDPSLLNSKQQKAFKILIQHLENPSDPLRLIISGTAGTGKSFLIDSMISVIEQNGKGVKVTAFTGVASNNIHGETINSLFQLSLSNWQPLQSSKLGSFQAKWQDIHYLIVDEMSMVSSKLFGIMNERLKQAFPTSTTSFGGMSIILLGDYGQIPPVGGSPLYTSSSNPDPYATLGKVGYISFNKCIILTEVMRQNEDEMILRDALMRVRNASTQISDWELFNSRALVNLTPLEKQHFEDAPRLYATKNEVQQENLNKLKSMNKPIVTIKAENSAGADKCSSEDASGLESTIYLCEGARVMLTSNLSTKFGLVNGSLGFVEKIIYSPTALPPSLPLFVLMKVDGYQGPSFNGLIPIPPIVRNWTKDSKSFSRKQLPLKLGWALTVHKSQGLTLPKVVVDFGEKEFSPGLTFVSLSRTKRLADLALKYEVVYQRFQNLSNSRYNERVKEEERLENLEKETIV